MWTLAFGQLTVSCFGQRSVGSGLEPRSDQMSKDFNDQGHTQLFSAFVPGSSRLVSRAQSSNHPSITQTPSSAWYNRPTKTHQNEGRGHPITPRHFNCLYRGQTISECIHANIKKKEKQQETVRFRDIHGGLHGYNPVLPIVYSDVTTL